MITRSDYRMLPQATREAVLAEIAQSIDRHGGTFDMDYESIEDFMDNEKTCDSTECEVKR